MQASATAYAVLDVKAKFSEYKNGWTGGTRTFAGCCAFMGNNFSHPPHHTRERIFDGVDAQKERNYKTSVKCVCVFQVR